MDNAISRRIEEVVTIVVVVQFVAADTLLMKNVVKGSDS